MTTATVSKSEANIFLDKLASLLYCASGMRATEFLRQMEHRLKHDEGELLRLGKQLADLSSSYHKYLDTQRQMEEHDRSIEKLTAVIGTQIMFPHEPESPEEVDEISNVESLRRDLELWEAIEQYLRFVPEAKIRDITRFLDLVDIGSTRQAVEAAINSRPKVFSVRKRKREKFVSLKVKK